MEQWIKDKWVMNWESWTRDNGPLHHQSKLDHRPKFNLGLELRSRTGGLGKT